MYTLVKYFDLRVKIVRLADKQ